jgi:sulfur-oxidizing protein SoxZ
MGIAVSQDPLLTFRIRGARPGDPIAVAWTDNLGATRRDTARVA